ncbi:MAG: hypothetical protein R3D25_14415 [Geminicoccaceae bacterium]
MMRSIAALPIPPAPFSGKIGRTAAESTPDFPKDVVESCAGAPNILLILMMMLLLREQRVIGGPIQTLNFQRLADIGLRA